MAALAILLCPAPRLIAAQDDARSLVAAMPAEADAVIVLRDLAAARATPSGEFLGMIWETIDRYARTSRAWSELSGVLDMPADRAFDELLGDRLALVLASDDSDEPRWALLSRVSTSTEATLRRRLSIAPRTLKGGVPVLSVERGRFELALSRRGWMAAPGRESVLLLTPSAHGDLFDRVLPLLQQSRIQRSIGELAPALLSALGDGQIVLVLRHQDGRLGMAASMTQGGWRIRIAADRPLAAAYLGGLDDTPLSRAARFTTDADTVLLAVGGLQTMPAFLADRAPTLLDSIRADTRAIGPDHRSALLVTAPHAGGDTLIFTLGIEGDGIESLSARGDRRIAITIAGAQRRSAGPDFGGLFPNAVRTAGVGNGGAAHTHLTWTYAPAHDRRDRAWWLIDAAPEHDARAHGRLRTLGAALAPSEGEPARYVTVGVVRPAMLAPALRADGALPLAAIASRLDRIDWLAWVDQAGILVGEIDVVIAE